MRAGLEAVAAEYGADEVLIVTMTHDHGARRRSYELIADAFAMRGDEQVADPLLASCTRASRCDNDVPKAPRVGAGDRLDGQRTCSDAQGFAASAAISRSISGI